MAMKCHFLPHLGRWGLFNHQTPRKRCWPLRGLAASPSSLFEHLLLRSSCHHKKSELDTWRDHLGRARERCKGSGHMNETILDILALVVI